MAWIRDEMAQCTTQGLADGVYVSQGRRPARPAVKRIRKSMDVRLQSESGLLGLRPVLKSERNGCRSDQHRQADGPALQADWCFGSSWRPLAEVIERKAPNEAGVHYGALPRRQ